MQRCAALLARAPSPCAKACVAVQKPLHPHLSDQDAFRATHPLSNNTRHIHADMHSQHSHTLPPYLPQAHAAAAQSSNPTDTTTTPRNSYRSSIGPSHQRSRSTTLSEIGHKLITAKRSFSVIRSTFTARTHTHEARIRTKRGSSMKRQDQLARPCLA